MLSQVGEAVGRATVGVDQAVEFLLRGLQRRGVPDPPAARRRSARRMAALGAWSMAFCARWN